MLSRQAGNSLVILLIILGLISGGVILENRFGQKLTPAPSSTPVASVNTKDDKPTIALTTDKNLDQLKKDDQFVVRVAVSNTIPVNLISTKINYPKDLVKVVSMDDPDPKTVSLWASKTDVSEEDFVELVGGIPSPGLNTDGERRSLVLLTFQMLQDKGDKKMEILPKETQFYSDQDNKPLEGVVNVALTSQLPPSPIPSPTNETIVKKGVLSLSPSIIQTAPSCIFDLTLNYDSANQPFLGIDALLTIDPKVLKPVKIIADANKPDTLYAPQLSLTGDTMTIIYLTPQHRDYRKSGSLGKISFKVTDQKVQGMTAIRVKMSKGKNDLSDSNIVSSLTEDMLSASKDTFVLIKPGSCNHDSELQTFQILNTP